MLPPKSSDPFREHGSKYEHDDPVGFATLPRDKKIRWGHEHFDLAYDFLYIPSPLFHVLYHKAHELQLGILSGINPYDEARFSGDAVVALRTEVLRLLDCIDDADVARAAGLILEKISRCIDSDGELDLVFAGI